MRVVAGADEAGQTPQTADGTQPKTEQGQPEVEQIPQAPGFGERGRVRRRARFLRKARELAYRDLGGLVFDLHRFGQRNDPLVLAKLATLRQIDAEVRELEAVLRERRPVTVLREVGIAACPRCAAIHGSDDRFCPGCGLAFDTKADRPISTAPVNPPAHTQVSAPPAAPAHTDAPAPMATSAPPRTSPTSAPAPAPAPTRSPASSSALPSASSSPSPAETPPRAGAPAPPAKPTAAPVAAKPVADSTAPGRKEADGAEEDEPTQILRPPARGA
jgi:hypothetical protein